MAYNESLAERIRQRISQTPHQLEEKKMFGGLCFMVNGKMCIGVEKDRIMVRLDPERYEDALQMDGCTPMDFTGRVMKGYVFVNAVVLKTPKKVEYWINLALEYNKIARVSKKK